MAQPVEKPQIIDPEVILSESERKGPIWNLTTTDLNLNLLRWNAGHIVESHVNNEVDVVGFVVAGGCKLIVNGMGHDVKEGNLFMIPKGAERSMLIGNDGLVYISCHRRRAGLMPTLKK